MKITNTLTLRYLKANKKRSFSCGNAFPYGTSAGCKFKL